MSVDGLVVAAFQRALKSSDTLLTFLLRCHRPATYNISSHAEQANEKEEPKKVGLTVLYQTGNKSLAQLLDFPIDSSMAGTPGFHVDSPEQIATKQARLSGTAGEPAPVVSDAPEPESG